ncbi:hypothetical protein NE535_05265, partial [Shewanella sp. SP1S2-7]|nr:hypothetical protein [Shewanella holmiensis]
MKVIIVIILVAIGVYLFYRAKETAQQETSENESSAPLNRTDAEINALDEAEKSVTKDIDPTPASVVTP